MEKNRFSDKLIKHDCQIFRRDRLLESIILDQTRLLKKVSCFLFQAVFCFKKYVKFKFIPFSGKKAE